MHLPRSRYPSLADVAYCLANSLCAASRSVCIPGANDPLAISLTSNFGVGAIRASADGSTASAMLSTTYSQQELVGLVQNVLVRTPAMLLLLLLVSNTVCSDRSLDYRIRPYQRCRTVGQTSWGCGRYVILTILTILT